jgi:glucosamine kinase
MVQPTATPPNDDVRVAPRFIAGVDGGGSGTRVRLQAVAGATLGRGQAGPSALTQGVAQAWRHIVEALDAAFRDAGVARPANGEIALGLGLAGVESEANRQAFVAACPGFARCVLFGDAQTTLQGAFGRQPGIVIAAGTGSVGLARWRDGSLHHAGGWGFPAGDEGSGAWLGLRAVQVAQRALDGRAAAGALAHAVWQVTGGSESSLLRWWEAAGQHAYARLAPLVFDAAQRGDGAASALLNAAAAELAALAQALSAAQPPAAEPLPIVLTGGIGPLLRERWPAALRARVVEPQGDSSDGALALLRDALAADGVL